MTRRGSLAYYLAAVVCGSFFLTVTYFAYFLATGAKMTNVSREFFFTYFFGVLLSIIPLTLIAFFLRRLAVRLRWQGLLPWLAGAWVVGAVVLAVLSAAGHAVEAWRNGPVGLKHFLLWLFIGPWFMTKAPLWLPLPGLTAMAWVLFRVHSAFEPAKEAAAPAAWNRNEVSK
jgi:hypothetical protein